MTAPPVPRQSVRCGLHEALSAACLARVGIVAFRDGHGRPMAWPITPYVDDDALVVTSTLAYLKKAEHIRNDRRIAVLADGLLAVGDATVHADPSGDRFVERLLDQEREKFPPLRQIESVPASRKVFAWYYGRAHIVLRPRTCALRPGDDTAVLVAFDAGGYPTIMPVTATEAAVHAERVDLGPAGRRVPDGEAVLLIHAEDDAMEDLRSLHARGQLKDGVLTVTRRFGSLQPAGRKSVRAQLAEQIDLYKRGRHGRRRMAAWT